MNHNIPFLRLARRMMQKCFATAGFAGWMLIAGLPATHAWGWSGGWTSKAPAVWIEYARDFLFRAAADEPSTPTASVPVKRPPPREQTHEVLSTVNGWWV